MAAVVLDLTQDWERYPCNLPNPLSIAEGESQRQALQADTSRLFSGRDDVEVWKNDHIDDGTIMSAMPPGMRLNASRQH